MINVMRKNQRILWIVIAFLAIPFVFYFQADILNFGRSNEAGRVYGEAVSHVEFQRNMRLFELARDLGMMNLLQDLVAGAQTQNEAYSEFTWNRMILRHEAERLGIVPTTTEIANVVRGLMPFRGEKGFDPNKYNQFVQVALPSMGFNEAQIEELAADQLALERLKEIVGTGVQIPEAESRENYERAYGKLNLSVVRVRTDEVAKDLQISDEEITKYYETNKAELKSEEKRKVSFVTFGLNEEQKKLTGKERVEVLQKLADGANDFSQALLEKGAQFEQVAAKFQLPIQTTGEFSRATPDPLLAANPQFAEASFQLTPQQPDSDALQAGDGFYILHLSGVNEAKPLSSEEARPKIVEALRTQRQRALVAAKGAEAAQKIREALKSGTPVEAALQQTGLPVEKIPPFALADPPAPRPEPGKPPEPQAPDLQMIKRAVAEIGPGEVSELIPTEAGGVVAVLEKRDQPDPAAYEQGKAAFNLRFLRGKREVAFQEWLRERRREAGVQDATASAVEPAAG